MPPDKDEQLLALLRKKGSASAQELASALGVSQPTVSRRIQSAGDRLCKMGQTRATRYAATRELPGVGRSVPMYRITEAGACVPRGTLSPLTTGQHWDSGTDTLFEGLPPFAADMSPQGYLGRTFGVSHPDLPLPPRLADWSDDHGLIALAQRGEDCVGDLILGTESLDRWFQRELVSVQRGDYPRLALGSARERVGSSAGGDQPKFLTYREGRHVLVKFASQDPGEVAGRWRDLLVCESLALSVLREAGLDAASAHWFDEGGHRFLEVERFDRVGERGRRGTLTLRALDNEYFGDAGPGTWTSLAPRLQQERLLPTEDARRLRWLEVFGQLIANTDRHFGNVSVFASGPPPYRLAPAYDMLPMAHAPSSTVLVERDFQPKPPTAATLDVWAEAAHHASRFWKRAADEPALSEGFREIARRCGERVETLRARVAPQLGV